MRSGGETFSEGLTINGSARRKEAGELLGAARREAHLSQKVVAAVLNYDQSDISRIEGGTRLPDVVELENFAVLYQKPLSFFPNSEGPA
jgi:transcriptional regulator with XRE-family HTH domain